MAKKSGEYSDEDTTPAPAATQTPPPAPAAGPDDFKTEQEKGPIDPISPSEPSPGPVQTIEEQGIGARMPYPSKEGGG